MKFFFLFYIYSTLTFGNQDYRFDSSQSIMIPNFAGKILLKKGQVYIVKKNGKKILSVKGTKVYQKQTIITSTKSFAKIKLVDQTILTIGPNSKLKIEKFKFRNTSDRDSIITLLQGKLRSHYRVKSKKAGQLQININQISLGIRGTKVLANIKEGSTQIALLEGKANIVNNETGTSFDLNSKDYYNNEKVRRLNKREIATLKDGQREDLNNFLPFLNIAQTRKNHRQQIEQHLINNHKKDHENSFNWKKNLNRLNQKIHEN